MKVYNDIIRKCAINKSTDIKKWVGVLGKDENRTKEFRKSIMNIRHRTSKDIENRIRK